MGSELWGFDKTEELTRAEHIRVQAFSMACHETLAAGKRGNEQGDVG